LTQACEVFPMHQIGAHESNDFEQTVLALVVCCSMCRIRKAISATAIWMRTAFSERPMKWVI